MRSVNIHEARTHLSRLVEEAARGNVFVIAKAGKPMVKVVPYSEGEPEVGRRLGFMAGEIAVPDDFDPMAAEETGALFSGTDMGGWLGEYLEKRPHVTTTRDQRTVDGSRSGCLWHQLINYDKL